MSVELIFGGVFGRMLGWQVLMFLLVWRRRGYAQTDYDDGSGCSGFVGCGDGLRCGAGLGGGIGVVRVGFSVLAEYKWVFQSAQNFHLRRYCLKQKL